MQTGEQRDLGEMGWRDCRRDPVSRLSAFEWAMLGAGALASTESVIGIGRTIAGLLGCSAKIVDGWTVALLGQRVPSMFCSVPQSRTSRLAFLWPRYVQSVGLMREMGARIAAYCPVCKTMFRVDLEAIIQRRGQSYSLIDQRGPCRRYGCEGKAGFMWSPGEGVPFRPLSSDAGDDARMARARTGSASPDDDPPPDEPPPHVPPPRAPRGVDPELWAVANERERKRLVRQARG